MSISEHIDDRLLPLWQDEKLSTPAYVYDAVQIIDKLNLLDEIRKTSDCHILYSVKALSFAGVLSLIAEKVDGFSTSSLNESQLAREILGDSGSIHMTSPGIRPIDMDVISEYCDYVSFNSISQWQQCAGTERDLNCGLRINPELSFVGDDRYDPCRDNSKLGIPLSLLSSFFNQGKFTKAVNGIHIHNNCESENFHELKQSIAHVCQVSDEFIPVLEWINLGGGYLFNNSDQMLPLEQIASYLKQRYGADVFFEPGKAIVGRAGYLVASVIDLFNSGGKHIAVLDTTVNHLPEVFEYQYSPQVLKEQSSGLYCYRLAGASCLSGDLFGDYWFDEKLSIGCRIIFTNVGAYMSVKANMFNGINLPAVYLLRPEGKLELLKEFDYQHYRDRL